MPGSPSPDILIVGAGPAGLTAAAEALRHGLSVRVIDRNESRSLFSKAVVVHSRPLEVFQDMGLVSCLLEHDGTRGGGLPPGSPATPSGRSDSP